MQAAICENCRRQDTSHYAIDVQEVQIATSFKWRKFAGHRGWISNEEGTANLCQPCRLSCDRVVARNPDWKNACYGHIWYLLNSRTGQDLDFVIATLPWSVRYWWYHEYCELPEAVYDKMFGRDCVLPTFQDITRVRNKMHERLDGFDIRGHDLVTLAGKHCLPNIQCPMGCLLLPDDEAQFVGYHQLFASKLQSKYRYFSGDRRYFIGARADWPSIKTFLHQPVLAGLYMDKKGGMCCVLKLKHCLHIHLVFHYI